MFHFFYLLLAIRLTEGVRKVELLMIQIIFWDWIEFAVRWTHVITAIAWIGSSFYFIALDLGLRHSSSLPQGVKGQEWQVHGGGFYNIRKFIIAPPDLPEKLVWFKWESYATWLSGFALLAVVYYGGAELILVDTNVLELSSTAAILLSVGSLALGWIAYNFICKLNVGKDDTRLMLMLFFMLVGFAWLYCNIFSGRAAFLHLGALTATIMSANVFFIIIPNQKIVVADLIAGKSPDPNFGVIAKQRSTHNNYLTLPVIFMMISNHYPLAFGARYNWIIAALVFLMGVSIRHYFNQKHASNLKPIWAWVVTFFLFLSVVLLSFVRPPSHALDDSLASNSHRSALELAKFVDLSDTIVSRCGMCHAREPLWDGMVEAPGGLLLETKNDIARNAKQIYINAGISNYMPPNNISYMEPEERQLIVDWFEDYY